MNHIVHENLTRNGNGVDAINGRGTLRRKLTSRQRIALGADIALGTIPLAPSLRQSAAAVGISVFELRKELKARERVEAWRRAIEQRLNLQAEAETVNEQADAIVAAWETASRGPRGGGAHHRYRCGVGCIGECCCVSDQAPPPRKCGAASVSPGRRIDGPVKRTEISRGHAMTDILRDRIELDLIGTGDIGAV